MKFQTNRQELPNTTLQPASRATMMIRFCKVCSRGLRLNMSR
jgi:hypothetical protein